MNKKQFIISMAILLSAIIISGCVSNEEASSHQLTDWKIAPAISAKTDSLKALAVTDTDELVITANYPTTGWIKATVPGTVLGNLVDNGIYDGLFDPDNEGKKNVYFGNNLSRIPAEDFDHEWWYSTDFTIPSSEAGKRITLTFKGISYTGTIYVNGTKVINKYNNIAEEDYLKNGPTLIDTEAAVTDFETEGAGSLKGVSD